MSLDSAQIQKPVRRLRKLAKKITTIPSPQQVHDLRTNTRKLEAALGALQLDRRGPSRRLLKQVSRVRKRAGKVRDMDVITGFAASVHVDGERACYVQLLEHLGAQRHRYAKKLLKTVTQRRHELRRRLKQISRRIDKTLCKKQDKDCDPAETSARTAAAALRLKAELARPVRLDRKNLHPYRLKVKELRNVLRLAEKSGQREFVDALGEVKDAIGEWHDWEQLAAVAADLLDHGSGCRLVAELEKIAAAKFDRALAEAEKMRAVYLRTTPGNRRSVHRVTADRSLSAISMIAA